MLKFGTFRQRQRVFDIDTEIADRTLDLGVPKQDLDSAQVARPETVWEGGEMQIEVTDDEGRVVTTVIVMAIDAQTPESVRKVVAGRSNSRSPLLASLGLGCLSGCVAMQKES